MNKQTNKKRAKSQAFICISLCHLQDFQMLCIPGGNGLSNKPSSGRIPLGDINNGKYINPVLCSFLLNTHLRAKMPKQPENTLCLLRAVFKRSVPSLATHEQRVLQCLTSCRTCSKWLKNYNDRNKIRGSSEKGIQAEECYWRNGVAYQRSTWKAG